MVEITMSRAGAQTALRGTVGELVLDVEEPLPYAIPSNLEAIRLQIDDAKMKALYSTQQRQVQLTELLTNVVFRLLANLDALRGKPIDEPLMGELFEGYSEILSRLIHSDCREVFIPTWKVQRSVV